MVRKDTSTLHRAIDVVLKVVTFGQMRAYLDGFQTTIAKTVYVTAGSNNSIGGMTYATSRDLGVMAAYAQMAQAPNQWAVSFLTAGEDDDRQCRNGERR